MSRVVLPPKLVAEVVNTNFDFTSRLAIAETISTQVVTASVYAGTDANPSALINGSATQSAGIVTQSITGGVAGVLYELLCKVTTSGGQTLELAAYLVVILDLP